MDIVELPPLGRRIEWPTIGLAFVIYAMWFATTFYWRDLPWPALAVLGAWTVAWQMNLQHEVIHGHPTPSRLRQPGDRRLAAVFVAALLDLPRPPICATIRTRI